MNCETCREKRADPVPYIVHESAMARQERTVKRLWIILMVTILLLVGTNAFWVYYESQFADETWTYEATTENGGNAIANGEGEVYIYGNGENNSSEADP